MALNFIKLNKINKMEMKSFCSSLWPLPNEQLRNMSPRFPVLLMILYNSGSSQEVPFLQWKDKYMTPKSVCMFTCAVCALVYESSCVWANVSKCKCACMYVWRGQTEVNTRDLLWLLCFLSYILRQGASAESRANPCSLCRSSACPAIPISPTPSLLPELWE